MILELIIAGVGLYGSGYATRWFMESLKQPQVVKEISTITTLDKTLISELATWFETETKKSENTLRRESKLYASKLRGLL